MDPIGRAACLPGAGVTSGQLIRYSNSVTTEQHGVLTRRGTGRTIAWLAKQVELGLAAVDLSLPQYRVLGLLSEGSSVSSAVAEQLAVRPPSVTALIDGLVARGLVDRRTIEGDRRRMSLEVTDEGRRMITAADTAVDARMADIARMLGDEDDGDGAVADIARWLSAFALLPPRATRRGHERTHAPRMCHRTEYPEGAPSEGSPFQTGVGGGALRGAQGHHRPRPVEVVAPARHADRARPPAASSSPPSCSRSSGSCCRCRSPTC